MSDFKPGVLFVCIHNSARSQMAEAFLKKYGNEKFIADSAGIEAGKMNPSVVKVMDEVGIDLSRKGTQDVFDLFRKGNVYNAVITVCDTSNAERCPVFPGAVKRVSWSFEDPSAVQGTQEEVLAKTRQVRDEIDAKIKEFVAEASEASYWM